MKRKLWLAGVVAALVLVAPGMGAGKKDKPEKTGEIVDSGSFGVFVGGKRVATEKFQIEKREDGNVSSSELTVDDGNQKFSQTAQLKLAGGIESPPPDEPQPVAASARAIREMQRVRRTAGHECRRT